MTFVKNLRPLQLFPDLTGVNKKSELLHATLPFSFLFFLNQGDRRCLQNLPVATMAAAVPARAPARIQYGNRWSPRSGEREEDGSESSKKNSSYLRSSAPKCEAGKLTLLEKEDR